MLKFSMLVVVVMLTSMSRMKMQGQMQFVGDRIRLDVHVNV